MRNISKTALAQLFKNKISFDPRVPGPMKIMADIGNNEYYKLRAIECIQNGQLILAIRLLLFVVWSHCDGQEEVSKS